MLGKLDSREKNSEKPYTIILNKHTPCGLWRPIKLAYDKSNNKTFYKGILIV